MQTDGGSVLSESRERLAQGPKRQQKAGKKSHFRLTERADYAIIINAASRMTPGFRRDGGIADGFEE